MDLDIEKLILASVGVLIGVAGTLATLWVNWGIEKKRERQKTRKDLIQRTREFISSTEWNQLKFNNTVTYSEIRQHLTEGTRRSIEGGTITIQVGRGGDVIKSAILDDISKKEKEWGII